MEILAAAANHNDLFTSESLKTLAGITGITMIIANGIQRTLNWNPRWLALAIAEFFCLAVVYDADGRFLDYLLGIANGFLVYCTASGGTNAGGAIVSSVQPLIRRQTPERQAGPECQRTKKAKRIFFSPWP